MAYTGLKKAISSMDGWLLNGITPDTIDFASGFGAYLADSMNYNKGSVSTSHIRSTYGEVIRLKMRFNLPSVLMIKPKAVYAAKRAKNSRALELAEIISAAVDIVGKSEPNKQKQVFDNFASLFEAILAYHKVNGGN